MPCTYYFLITVLYMHHNSPISDLSFCSCEPGYIHFLELFDTVLMKTTKIHSSLQTPTHNLTPPLQKLPLSIPIIPIVSKSHPNLSYPIINSFENPNNQPLGLPEPSSLLGNTLGTRSAEHKGCNWGMQID